MATDVRTLKINIQEQIKVVTEKDDILTILEFMRQENIQSSENNNGTFVNLNSLNKKTLVKLNVFITDLVGSKKTEFKKELS